MSRACRRSILLLAVMASLARSHACAVHVDLPAVPLPALPAARPVEDFIPVRGSSPPVELIPAIVLSCGGAFDAVAVAALGLIELFGSAARFETALAARRVEVAALGSRTDLFTPAAERAPGRRLLPADALRLRDWLTSDASYRWGEDLEWPLLARGVRVTFYHAGKVVQLDLHPDAGVAVVGSGEAMAVVKFEPLPADLEDLIACTLR